MNNLHFSLIKDQATKRRVQILSMFAESTLPINIETFLTSLDIGKSTFDSDISYLVSIFPDTIRSVTYNNKPALERSITVADVTENVRELLTNIPLATIIKTIFEGRLETISYYSEILFISHSSVRHLLALLKDVLKQFDLKLSTNPVDITGDESNIRYFFFRYFRYARIDSTMFGTSKHFDFIYHTIKEISADSGSVLSIDYYRLACWLFIIETRIAQNHNVILPHTKYAFFNGKSSFIQFKKAVNNFLFTNNFLKRITEDEIMFAYIVRLDALTYEDQKYYFTDDYFGELKQFEHITSSFFSEAKLSLASHYSLRNILEAFLMNTSTLSQLTPLFQKTDSTIINLALKKHPETIALWKKVLIESQTFDYTDDLAASLTLITEAKLQSLSNKNILFALTGEPASMFYYKEMVRKYVPKDMTYFFLFNQPLTESALYHLNIDICVLNFKLAHDLGTVETIELSSNPSEAEWMDLLYKLHKI